MELYIEMLLQNIKIDLYHSLETNKSYSEINTLIENKCYDALVQIRDVIRDEILDDIECFNKIEKIICIYEALGCDCGARHDF